MAKKHLTYEDRFSQIEFEVDKRRRSYDLHTVPWADARQIILLRIWLKYHLYDEEKGPFPNWVQRVITNAILTIWRDNLTVHSRPCILGCVWNAGGDQCERTPSGRQCAECPAFKIWEQSYKKDRYSIRQPVALDNHTQEVNNQQSDFMDIEGKKVIIDNEIKKRLYKLGTTGKQEWRVYKLLMIKGGTEQQAAKLLGFKQDTKRKKRGKRPMFNGYLKILELRHKFVALAKIIIEEEALA